jgi:hypothetical protein
MSNMVRYGFWPADTISNGTLHSRRFEVATAYATGTGIFLGSPVALVTSGTVENATTNGQVIGVSNGASYLVQTGNGLRRISAKYLPSATAYTPTTRGSANAAWIYAYDDPGIEYEGQFNAALTSDYYKYIGCNCPSTTPDPSGSTTTGISYYQLDATTLATTAYQWRINYLVDTKADNDVSLIYSKALVQYCTSAGGGNPLLTTLGISP